MSLSRASTPDAGVIEIRPIAPEEAEAVRRLKIEAAAAHPTQFAYSPADVEAMPAGCLAAGFADSTGVDKTFGVYRDGVLQGLAEVVQSSGRKSRHLGEMKSVYIRPELRGQGVASRLVGEVVRYAGRHLSVLCAAVGLDNPTARIVYERHGFRSYGVHPSMIRIDGRDIPGDLLVLMLEATPAET